MSKIIAVGKILDFNTGSHQEEMAKRLARNERRQLLRNLDKKGLSTLFFQADFGAVSLTSGRPLDALVPKSISGQFQLGEHVRVELIEDTNGKDGKGYLIKEKLAL